LELVVFSFFGSSRKNLDWSLLGAYEPRNGRVARMLAILMALQAALPPLDFSGITGKKKKEYIEAIHAGFQGKYEPMEKIFESVIRRTLKARGWR
jgi:cell filamentation protein